jgi:4'-phosphopantetheinyl transferase
MAVTVNMLNEVVELSEKKIHVFLLHLDEYDEEQLYEFLSKDEKERADRLKVELKKKQFIISRSVLRKIISTSLNKSHDEIAFHYTDKNKPFIKDKINNKKLEFNVSHSEQCILIAVTLDNSVGVDVEKINANIDFESLSARFFSKKENQYLSNLEDSKKLNAFYNIWTRKEAFIKATGKGIAYGLDNFSVCSDNEFTSKIDIAHKEVLEENWFSFELMSIEQYKTALSTNNKEAELIFYQ